MVKGWIISLNQQSDSLTDAVSAVQSVQTSAWTLDYFLNRPCVCFVHYLFSLARGSTRAPLSMSNIITQMSLFEITSVMLTQEENALRKRVVSVYVNEPPLLPAAGGIPGKDCEEYYKDVLYIYRTNSNKQPPLACK